jgi:hypothetical protein
MPRQFDMTGDTVGRSSAGGSQGGLASYYNQQQRGQPYGVQQDPYMHGWAQEGMQNQLADRQKLQDLYGMLQKQAQGGVTPQQQMLQAGMLSAQQGQGSVAQSAAGGPRARLAAQGAMQQNAGVTGMQNQQSMSMQKNADMMQAQNQMQQVAAMQRANDLQAQGMTADDAMRQAQAEARARGLNIQHELGYAGLEQGAIAGDYGGYMDAARRGAKLKEMAQQQRNMISGQTASGISTGLMVAGAVL